MVPLNCVSRTDLNVVYAAIARFRSVDQSDTSALSGRGYFVGMRIGSIKKKNCGGRVCRHREALMLWVVQRYLKCQSQLLHIAYSINNYMIVNV